MKRILLALLLSAQCLLATVISGKITDLTGQTMSSNRSVVFTLMNCGNNLPRIVGSAVISPATKTIYPNPAGLLTGTIVGNDIVECGTTIGQTFYNVAIFTGTQKTYEKQFYITGPTWNIATAIPLSNDPTAFLNFSGYLLGDLIYGSGTNTLGLVRGNTSTTPRYLTQVGDGVHSGMPYWSEITVPLHASTHNSGAADALSGTLGVSITGNAATVSNGVYTNGTYTDPNWLTLTKGKVGLSAVENVALSAWTGSSNLATVGTLVTGVWHGTAIGDAYIASAAVWNAKMSPLGFTPENTTMKGVSNGYAALDGNGQVPVAQLPAAAGMTALVSDVTPKLGGNLDLNGKNLIGHLLFSADSTYDIGANAGSRPRYVYGSSMQIGYAVPSIPPTAVTVFTGSNAPALQVNRYSTTIDDYTGILLGVTQSVTTNQKAGIFFQRKAANGVGTLIFAMNGAADATNVLPTDAALTINYLGNVGIGFSGGLVPFTVRKNGTSHQSAISVENASIGSYGAGIVFRPSDTVNATPLSSGRIYGVFDGPTYPAGRITIQTVTGMDVFQDVLTIKGTTVGIGLTGPSYQLQLSTDSAAKPTSSTWTITSDSRVKTNIRPFTDGLDILKQLRPVVYELNGKAGLPAGSTGIGLIAQEAQPVVPYMIGSYKAKLNPEDAVETDILNLNASSMPWLLANAIRDLEKQTFQPVFPEDVEPACSEANRAQTRFVKDDLLGDQIRSCGRSAAGVYSWRSTFNF